MATKNFSYLHASLLVSILTLTSACSNLKTREQVNAPTQASGNAHTQAIQNQFPSSPSTSQSAPTGATSIYQPPIAPTPPSVPVADPTLGHEVPKIGVILGPGGMKAFAHIGVLKEMARLKLPIHSIAGLEWGALMAGIYSMQGQVNEVEWKSFKLREEDIPQSGMLSKAIRLQKTSGLTSFLNTVFTNARIEKSKVEFACPTYNLKQEKLAWWNRGDFRDGIKGCIGYPPYYRDTDGWLAAPFAVEEAAAYLRARGANMIIYVNVMGGEVMNEALTEEQYSDYVLWSEAKRQGARKVIPGVNSIITVNTESSGLTDYENRRQMVEAGSKAAHDVISKIATQYGY